MANLTPASGCAVNDGVLVPTVVHLDDLDPWGMLHNGHYSVLAERAWITYFRAQEGFQMLDGGRLVGDGFAVVKEMRINYEYPITQPGTVGVQLWIERMGRTSLTHGFRVCSADSSLSHANGTRTIVRLNPETLRPMEWSARAREICAQLTPRGHADQ